MSKLLSLLSLLILFSACGEEELAPGVITDPALATALRGSPESVTVGESTVTLTAYLWRDFMPGTGEGARLLNGVVRLWGTDNKPVGSEIKLRRSFLVKGDDVWSANFSDVRTGQAPALEGVVRKGPAWEVGTTVDVIVEFEKNGELFKVLARGQKVNATY